MSIHNLLTTPAITFHLSNLLVGLVAVLSGVASAIANYFWLHSDTDLTRRQMWEHIWGLLSFFVLGNLVGGVFAYVSLRILGWL